MYDISCWLELSAWIVDLLVGKQARFRDAGKSQIKTLALAALCVEEKFRAVVSGPVKARDGGFNKILRRLYRSTPGMYLNVPSRSTRMAF